VTADDDNEQSGRRPRPERSQFSLRTARMEAFSDGVFAIAITLLVLEIAVPAATEKHIGHALLEQWPIYLAYFVSFASIGNAWLNHSLITEYLNRTDSILLRLNLLLLLFVSILPFPTKMISTYLHNVTAERVSVVLYGCNLLAIAGLTGVIWHYAVSEQLVRRDADDDELRALAGKIDPSLISYAVAIGVGLLFPRAGVALFLAIAVYLLIPYRAIIRWFRRHRHA